jgi:hypothetical protein
MNKPAHYGFAALFGLSAVSTAIHANDLAPMVDTFKGWKARALHTNGATIPNTSGTLNPSTAGDYAPVGILDGLGAYELDGDTVRVFANHELLHFRGNTYEVSDGQGGTLEMSGARVSYFDLDKRTLDIVDAGIAYNVIYDANGKIATEPSFLANDLAGFSRFCSSALFEAEQFGSGSGLEDRIYFTGEEDGGRFNPVGGGEWALDPETGSIWHAPAMGRGAWENVTEVDTGTSTHVASILADDSSPFDFEGDGDAEPVPLYLYIGTKEPGATVASGAPDFLSENGLRNGKLFVWVADSGVTRPSEFNTSGTQTGNWVEIDNVPTDDDSLKSETGEFGFDEFGYPTQGNLVLQAKAAGAFGFSRPEDVSTNPKDGTEFVLASTGVDNYDIDATGNGADTFGTMYTMKRDLSDLSAPRGDLTILYDGDADPTRALRSPDNLDWADNGKI